MPAEWRSLVSVTTKEENRPADVDGVHVLLLGSPR